MPCRAGTTAWQFQTAAHGQMALRSGSDEHIKKEHRRFADAFCIVVSLSAVDKRLG